jgi:hypothetical protein
MAMNGALLGTQLLQAVDTAVSAHPTANATQRAAIWDAIGKAIVDHVRTATVNVTVTSVSGVTVGVGVSGPGTGSATIT